MEQAVKKEQTERVSRKKVEAKSANQEDAIHAICESDVAFCVGPPGSGKSYLSMGMACEYYLEQRVSKIVITKPVIETGKKGLGYLPGTMAAKLSPYMISIKEELKDFLGARTLDDMIREGNLEVCPLEYMRGRNFHNSFIIGEEFQNATYEQIKMFLTRIGRNSKMVINGDMDQTDLYPDEAGGLEHCLDRLETVDGVAISRLEKKDIVRNGIISDILIALGD